MFLLCSVGFRLSTQGGGGCIGFEKRLALQNIEVGLQTIQMPFVVKVACTFRCAVIAIAFS